MDLKETEKKVCWLRKTMAKENRMFGGIKTGSKSRENNILFKFNKKRIKKSWSQGF